MTSKPNPFKRLWTNLKERHVTRIAIAYLGVGWGVLETLEFTLGLLQAPDWIFRAGVALVGLGFPVALVLSWIFDIRGGQVVRTDGKTSRWSTWVKAAVSAPVLVLVVVSSYWVWTGYVEEKERSLRPTDLGDEVPIVAVLPIRNLTGNPELDWFGEGIVNLVRDNLSRSRFLRIASPQKLKAIVGDATDELEIAELAAEQDIGFIMAGEMLMTPAGIYVSSRLTDTAGGVVLSAKQVENLEPATILEAAGPIAAQIRRGLGVPREEQVDVFVADFAIDNLEAYEYYLTGLQYFLNYDYERSLAEFQSALASAPDFGAALYRVAYIEAVLGDTVSAKEKLQTALEDPFMLDRERRYVEAAVQYISRDYAAAISTYEALLTEYPYEVEAQEFLVKCYWGAERLDDAVALLEQMTREDPGNEVAWSTLGYYLLQMGAIDRAQTAIDRFATLAPENPNSQTLMGDLAFARGALDSALRHYRQAVNLDPDMIDTQAKIASVLWAAGNAQDAVDQFSAMVANAALQARERLDAMFALTGLLAGQGNFEQALHWLARLEPELRAEQVQHAMALAHAARYRLELGQISQAVELAERAIGSSPGVPTRYLFTRGLIELARKDNEAALATAREMHQHALPEDNPDRTEEKAAQYLAGVALINLGRGSEAERELRGAIDLEGFEYLPYHLGLARLYLDMRRHQEALEMVDLALKISPGDPRFDLELDRSKAMLTRGQILFSAGRLSEAKVALERFLEMFRDAPPDHHDVRAAEKLLSALADTRS